jgi:hypothetical protein
MRVDRVRTKSVRARISTGVVAALLLSAVTVLTGMLPARAADPCAAPTNPIVCENSKAGTPATVWDTGGADDETIQGFATDISVNAGTSVSFKVKTSAAYTMTVYRLGWYQGNGARQITTLTPVPRTQPACLSNVATGLYDCGNWSVSASWAVPSTAVSGVYIVLLHRNDTGGESHIPFIVRNDASHSGVVFQTSDPTWQAYNLYGGSDFYRGTAANGFGRATKISYNRPIDTRGATDGRDFLFANEYPLIRFMESNGYDVSYISGVDTDRLGSLLQNHQTFVSVGHDEYWSGGQRANVEAARDAGVNLAFFSGNEVYWKTRWESSVDGSGQAYRTLVCYKETWDNAKTDPSSEWTGTWRDPRFSPPANGGRPENALTGTAYMSNNTDLPLQVPAAQGKSRFWRGTTVATQTAGQTANLGAHLVGYESDEDLDNGSRPAGLIDLSTSTGATQEYLQDFGTNVLPGTTTHHMTMYRAPSGALVFSSGTIQYAWGLDTYHDGTATTPSAALRQATVNLLADMGQQPLTLVSPLVAAAKSADATAPAVSVTSPAAGATLSNGALTTISGTATDSGGVVAGVEVSVDGGATWHPATGTSSWSYQFYAKGTGTVGLKVRASDDSGNLSAAATRTVTVNCPCSVFGNVVPQNPAVSDTSDVELGVKIQPQVDGIITGIRFYKGTGNTGTHVGTLWSSTGSPLATGTFTNETASGWQSMTFSTPVTVAAGTTYVASYRAPVGHYAADPLAFSASGAGAAPLKALRSVGNGGDGVYADGGGFPSSSYQDANYYVDAAFNSAASIAPAVVTSTPAAGSTAGARVGPLKATFNVSIKPGASMTVSSAAGPVTGTVVLDSTAHVLSFTPASALAATTSYTVTVSGAVSLSDIPMAAPTSWSFTTVGPCPCSVFPSTSTPTLADSGDTAGVELGMRFVPGSDGMVTGVRFYKSAVNTGTHTGSLWSSTGALLAKGTFTAESASGWQSMTFDQPVAVTAGTAYVVSYWAPGGHYSYSGNYFTADVTAGSLTAPAVGNGLYVYGGGFPTGTFNRANYWVDVQFLDSSTPDVTPPVITGATATADNVSAAVRWTTDEPANSRVAYGTSPSALTSTATSAGNGIEHLVTLSGLTAGTTYYFRVTSADLFGNSTTSPASTSAPLSITTATNACPCSLFTLASAPAAVDSGDTAAVELGVQFVPSTNGQITGIRFYKASSNVGTHTGSLWSATGVQLATGTFSNESASGWQTLTFGTPVPVTAGTTYVASYLAPDGHYSYNGAYFAAPVVVGPLTAPAGSNGLYRYGGGYPTGTYNSANYWVDVIFTS